MYPKSLLFFYHYCALSRCFLLNYLLTLRVFSSLNSECILYPSMHRSSRNYYLQYEFHHYNASQSHSSIRYLWSSSSSQVFCNLKTIVDFFSFPPSLLCFHLSWIVLIQIHYYNSSEQMGFPKVLSTALNSVEANSA